MSDNDLICICMAVSRGEILEKIRQGASSLDELKTDLLCCTGCGTCEGRVKAILEAALEAKNKKENSP